MAAYVTDFPATDDILGVDDVVCLPHLGASTPESEDNCAVMAAIEFKDYLENGNIINSVNYPAISLARTNAGDTRFCVASRMLSCLQGGVENPVILAYRKNGVPVKGLVRLFDYLKSVGCNIRLQLQPRHKRL